MKKIMIAMGCITFCLWGDIPLETSPFWSSKYYTGEYIHAVNLADVNNDGYPEVVTVYESGYIYLYYNQGGLIDSIPGWQSNDSGFNYSVTFGDYDNDGDLDMVIGGWKLLGENAKIYRNENGSLTVSPVWTGQGASLYCAFGDVDNDGDLDLACVDWEYRPCVYYNSSGTFPQSPSWSATDPYRDDMGVLWVDIDNDGDLDLLVGAWLYAPTLRIYYNHNGVLEPTASWISNTTANNYSAGGVAGCDVDKDGWLDIGVSTGAWVGYQKNCIFRNNNGTLENTPSWYSDDSIAAGASIFSDLNHDGFLDWAVNGGEKGVVYENNNGSLNTSYSWSSNNGVGGRGIDLGDVDQDGVVYKEDTLFVDGNRRLFYLKHSPIHRLIEITINGSPIPIRDYCYEIKSGWVSFKSPPPLGSLTIVRYDYSIDLELLLADEANNIAHLYRNNTNTGVTERVFNPESRILDLKVYPNPFRRNTEIRCKMQDDKIERNQKPSLKIYDAGGRLVKLLSQLTLNGEWSIAVWDGTDDFGHKLPAGIYFCQLKSGSEKEIKKIIKVQ